MVGHFAGVVNGIACYFHQVVNGWSLTASVRIAQVTLYFVSDKQGGKDCENPFSKGKSIAIFNSNEFFWL